MDKLPAMLSVHRYPRLAWIVLAVGLLMTAGTALYMKVSMERVMELEFTFQCHEIQNKITEKLDDLARTLQNGKALFTASDRVTRKEWSIYYQTQQLEKQLPGIQGIGLSLLIPQAELTRHLMEMRREGFPEYKLKPGGDREVYSSIIYLEPFSGRNLQAFGYDMFAEPVRRSAMERARDTDTAALSGKVKLVQENSTKVQAGALMYVPLYRRGMPIATVAQRRAAIYGWVYSPCRMEDLMQATLGSLIREGKRQIHLQVFDGDEPSSASLLFESLPGNYQKSGGQLANHAPARFRQIPVDISGQNWTLRFTQTGGGFASMAYLSIWLIMLGGILLTLLLFALIRSLLNTRAEAQRMAENLTIDLRENRAMLKQILDTVPQAIFWKDKEGVYLGCNLVFPSAVGLVETEQVIGKTDFDMPWPREEAEIYRADDAQVFTSGIPKRNIVEPLQQADGTRLWISTTKLPLLDALGEVRGILGVFEDITDRKLTEESLRESEERNRTILRAAMDGFWLTDMQGRLLEVNDTYCRMSGYSEQELLSMTIADLELIESDDEIIAHIEKIKTSGEHFFTTQHHRKDGSIFDVEANIQYRPIEGGRTVTFMRDITSRELMVKELRSSKAAAEQATIAKSQFLSNMSHEIRTPLNAIIGFSSIVLKSTLQPRQYDFVQKIKSAGEELLNVINDILDFSKIEAGQLDIEKTPFMFDNTLANVINMVQQKSQEKGLKLLVDTSSEIAPCLIGDPHRLTQIMINLLSNAVKFTECGEVSIVTTLLKQESDRVQIKFTISDTGIGLSAEQINKLFQPFSQADQSTTRKFGGTGLGLSISKQLVALMDGGIWCESIPEQGSSFCFTAWFGIGKADDIASALADVNSAVTYDFSAFHILLVEDNEVNQQLTIELLRDTGVAVEVASNGAEAVALVTGGTINFDLVLMDIQMPVMDGYEATRLIRANSRFATLPIIAMTAHALREGQKKIIQAGMDGHITKPINVHTMLRIMGSFLGVQASSEPPPENQTAGISAVQAYAELDVAGALDRLNGNEKLYNWLLRSFVENKSNAVKIIEEALQSGDTELAERTAHTVKSSAGTIGAVELALLAQKLEIAIEQGEPEKLVHDALGRFAAEMNRMLTTLANRSGDNTYMDGRAMLATIGCGIYGT